MPKLVVSHPQPTAQPRSIQKSAKLANVCYDIRGPVLQEAKRMEAEGHRVLKLNIGNPAPFGFEAPEAIVADIVHNLPESQGYSDSRGIYSARTAVAQYYQSRGLPDTVVGTGPGIASPPPRPTVTTASFPPPTAPFPPKCTDNWHPERVECAHVVTQNTAKFHLKVWARPLLKTRSKEREPVKWNEPHTTSTNSTKQTSSSTTVSPACLSSASSPARC
jgi:hypothetical protein